MGGDMTRFVAIWRHVLATRHALRDESAGQIDGAKSKNSLRLDSQVVYFSEWASAHFLFLAFMGVGFSWGDWLQADREATAFLAPPMYDLGARSTRRGLVDWQTWKKSLMTH
ncbi:hypothetical protein AEM42_12760 [Betaproteobacteria bacterium UKL13-2]|nr:hypothetical protein AEM42_12760 [Betaproteobacteria bacterium UKL13-2]